jgi:two-component system sensor histidine kinase TctE
MLMTNNNDQVAYAAWDEFGHLVAGDARLLQLVESQSEESHLFRNVVLDGHDGRIVVLRNYIQGYLIYIAVFQTSLGSNRLSRDTLIGMMLPETMLMLVAMAVILFGVRQGLQPVESLRDEIISRSPIDLKPIQEAPAPEELRPIIHGINVLLENLSVAFASHRRFIADASHQLRTPLAALSSQIEVAMEQPPADSRAFLGQLLVTTQRTAHLANQLLSLARLEHTEESFCEKTQIDLRQIVIEAATPYLARADRKGVTLEFSLEPSLILGNALLLNELVTNLVDNALRYTPPGGQIFLSTQVECTHCVLILRDSGPGVPAHELDKLGIPFHRLHTSISDGCGLGLAIVREIARIHGVEVCFSGTSNSTGLQVSCRFIRELPMG